MYCFLKMRMNMKYLKTMFKTHWCNKDEYIDRDYEVYIPEVIGNDLRPFVVELFNIHILQNMLIEFRKENESNAINIQL